jgi:hypothetical protein
MNWTKARKFREAEEKYQPGKVFDNGRVVTDKPRDSLDARARREEAQWLKNQKLDASLKKRSK